MSIVEVTVKGQKGKCGFCHKVGDKVVFDGRSAKCNVFYSSTLMVLLPKVYAMMYDASFPWARDKDAICNACPDGKNPVVFKIRRVREKVAGRQ